jgi:hypothetical protein
MLKRILSLAVVLCISSFTVNAFDITGIGPDTEFLDSLNRNVTDDVNYLRSIADSYSDRFVVTEDKWADISAIDEYYTQLSAPLTVDEIDTGKKNLNTDTVFDEELRKKLNLFGAFGGLSGYTASFEPVAYFSIYRNIQLIGGYTNYTSQFENPDDAYWQCICSIEGMTKEVIPYNSRLVMLEKIRTLHANNLADNRFKIFLLVDGRINSILERSDV